jgi:ATP/maltotriose-dependent transcriptional regulator MalT
MEQAVQLTPDRAVRADRIVATARHLFQAGDVARARTMLEDLVEGLEPGPRRGRARYALAELDWIDPALIQRLAEETLIDAGDDLALRALTLDQLGWCLAEGRGSLDRALEMADEELAIARELGDDVILAFALSAKGEFSFVAGDPAWDALSSEAVDHERRIGLFPTYTSPRLARGWQLVRVGRFDEAETILLESLEHLRARGQVTFTWQPLWYLAELEWRRGDWAQAEAYVTEGLEIALGTGVEWARMHLLSTSAVMLSLRSRLDEARSQAVQALEIADRYGQLHGQLENRATLGFVELSAGDPRAAADAMAPSLRLVAELGIRDPGAEPYWPDILLAFAAADRVDEAQALAEDLETRATELDRPWAVSIAHLGFGLVADARGDHAGAIAWYERAIAGYEDDKQYVTRAWTFLALGRARRSLKQKRAAREAFEEARRLFAHVGAPRWVERADEELARISGVATSLYELTPTERRVAELVATGRTNREVAQELFLSIKTVEANLSRIYSKLGISSRRELADALAGGGGDPA